MIDRTIVAHRGLSALYPENTLLALEQAVRCGARAVEFDVQLTLDRVPVLFHDAGLRRLCGRFGSLFRRTWADLQTYSASCPSRFGRQYEGTRVASLAACVDFLGQHPEVTGCLEIKRESVERFGLKVVMDRVLQLVEPVIGQIQFLSFSEEVILYLHSLGVRQTNWVLKKCNDATREAAMRLGPAVLTCHLKRMPMPLWEGPWEWMVYQTEDPGEVLRLFTVGVRYVESGNVAALAQALPEYFNGGAA